MTLPFERFTVEHFEYVAPDGEVYRFGDNESRFLVAFSGLGMPNISYVDQSLQDGDQILRARFEQRVIQIIHRRDANDRGGYWKNRRELINILNPKRQYKDTFSSGILKLFLPDSREYWINVLPSRGPQFTQRNPNRWAEFSITETLRFVTTNRPFFYNPKIKLFEFTFLPFDGLCFPLCIPDGACFSNGNINAILDVQYEGDIISFPQIEIQGPISVPVIRNDTTSKEIFLKFNLDANQKAFIDLTAGSKTVVDNNGNNLLSVVDNIIDFATFGIEAQAVALGGLNRLRVFGTGITEGVTRIRFFYNEWFVGV